jgi:uncharacterized protein YggU (UPF0235/DUF167 family)
VALDVPRAQVTLVSGGTSRDKTFAVEGIGADEAEARLEAVVGGSR